MDQPSDDDDDDCGLQKLLWENHVNKVKRVSSTVLFDLGVPMPPGMVLKKSARQFIPAFKDIAMDRRMLITTEHNKINKKAFIAFVTMPVIMLLVFVWVSICKKSYASLEPGFWFSILHLLCTVTYLCWLRKKELALEKYRVEIAELVLEQRKKLPMVEVDNVEADQPATDLINIYCYSATIPLGRSALNTLIWCAALNGTIAIALFGHYYWSAHMVGMITVAVVICWIGIGRSYYCWGKLPVEYPPE